MAKLRISYNAPVILTFAIAAIAVYLLPGSAHSWFVSYPHLDGAKTYVGLVSYALGHASWEHLLSNFMIILLVGPLLEERYGSFGLLVMIVVTALIGGLANLAFGSHPLLGASGVAFMMIVLASTGNMRMGEIPLTFIAVAAIYLGGEIYRSVANDDNIAHGAHILGGIVGAGFGFIPAKPKVSKPIAAKPAALAAKPAAAKPK